jgi:pimeloyl-ACP methyl ester carboxylesterase
MEQGDFWKKFHHGAVKVNDVRLHYVEGGRGPSLLLIPGWPESWYAWRRVMPALVASGRHVIAVDPPGMGDSDHPETGYELKSVAKDIHEFTVALNLTKDGPIDVAGHDIGSWISYAYASSYPKDIRRLVLFDAALPGLTISASAGIPDYETNLKSWHFSFNRLNDLPEILVRGHEREYLTWIFMNKTVKNWVITSDDLDEYVRVFTKPGAVRASFAYYRAAFSPEGLAQNKEWAQQKLKMPILAVGSSNGVGDLLYKTLRPIATNVSGDIAEGCGHFVLEECPNVVSEHLIKFFSEGSKA